MTIEEAMCYLHNPEDEDCYNAKEVEAYKIIIKTLKQNPYDTKELEKVRQELLERGDETISFRDLVERFDNIDKEYNGQLWNLLQIYSNINILIGKEPCDDAISRQAVQDYVAKYLSQYLYNDVREAVEVIDEYIGELPPVTPQPKTGHWIYDNECHEHGHCSECGYGRVDLVNGEPHNFCRRCGCRMVEPQESEG